MGRGRRRWPRVVRVVDAATGATVAERARVATSLWARGRGLMLRSGLEPGGGLVIDPCSSIHTMWMRFPIDVLYVGRDDVVVRVAQAMRPWRLGPIFTGARFVIELPAGSALRAGIGVGARLAFEPVGAGGGADEEG